MEWNGIYDRRLAIGGVLVAALLAGCGGGDINIAPTTSDNSVDNSSTTTGTVEAVNPCASYVNEAGQVVEGSFESPNCEYSVAFADSGNNVTVDLTIPALDDGGAHIFDGSLFIGEAHSTSAELAAAGIAEGGDGPQLTIEAGATLAWRDNTKFVIINRGSTIFAVGTADAPITFTSVSDIEGTVDPEAVQQWGGMVINGFGVSNKCDYTGTRGTDLALDGECNIAAEGAEGLDESYYGGDNDADTSGRMEYVIVKHTGAQVANGDELNGISFGGVGSNTEVNYLQVYSTYDDGIEMFGGAVDFTNFAAVYVRDDSIDIDEGYIGSIDTALVIQSETDGDHCIESDGIGSYDDLDATTISDTISAGLNSAPTISNLTCIVSPSSAETGTHAEGHGWKFREGIEPTVVDSLVVSTFGVDSDDDNYCLDVEDTGTDPTLSGVVMICEDRFSSDGATVAAAEDIQIPLLDGQKDPTSTTNSRFVVLAGTPPIYSPLATDTLVSGSAADVTVTGTYIGAVLVDTQTDPFAGWTYGIFEDNRGQALWFE